MNLSEDEIGKPFERASQDISGLALRIVMISPLPPVKTGESSYTFNLIRNLISRPHIEIIAVTNPEADCLPKEWHNTRTLRIWKGKSILYPFNIWKRALELRPDIVHVQFGPHGQVYGGLFGEVMLLLLLLLRLAGIKTTITLHSTWIGAQVKARVASYRRLGKVSFLAAPFFKIYMKLLKWGTSYVQLSTARLNSALRRAFLSEYDFAPNSVGEIPHPCQYFPELPDSDASKRSLGLEGKKVILIFGYIRRGKGIGFAIRAMQRIKEKHPDALLLIAGQPLEKNSYEYLKSLMDLTKTLRVEESVRFVAEYIPEEKVKTFFSAADIILVPYTESVGASGPIHNYASFGKPIVAADIGFHMRETLGGSLVLFKAGSVDSLTEKLYYLLADERTRIEIGRKHREYAMKETWKLAAKRTLEYYDIIDEQ